MIRKTIVSLAAALVLTAGASTALAQTTTAFTYQGQLKDAGTAVNSPTDMQFSLWTAATGGSQVGSTFTQNIVPVSGGLFSTSVDFGVAAYGQGLWLQIAVRNPAGTGAFVPMGARQQLTGAPYSLATRGLNVNSSNRVGILASPDSSNEVALTLGSAGGLFPASAVKFSPGSGFDWDMAAFNNSGSHGDLTISRSGIDFPFILRGTGDVLLNGQAAGKVGIGTITPDAKVDIVGRTRLTGAMLMAGTGATSLFVGGNDSGTLSFPDSATPSDKIGVRIFNNSQAPGQTTLRAWDFNSNTGRDLVINDAGGNVAVGTSTTPAGVRMVVRQATNNNGVLRIDSGLSAPQYSVVGFADRGTQLWSAGLRPDGMFGIDRDGINTFLQIDQFGRIGMGGAVPTAGRAINVQGGAFCTGSVWTNACDKNLKEGFNEVNPDEVLAKVASLPITVWNYKGKQQLHMGPTAQDFRAAFGLGENDTSIGTVDADGVALAAIKSLNSKLQSKDAEIDSLKARLDKLEALLSKQAALSGK